MQDTAAAGPTSTSSNSSPQTPTATLPETSRVSDTSSTLGSLASGASLTLSNSSMSGIPHDSAISVPVASPISSSTSQTNIPSQPMSQPPGGHHDSNGAIIGGTLGALAAIVVLFTIFLVLLKWRRRRDFALEEKRLKQALEPFPANVLERASNALPDARPQDLPRTSNPECDHIPVVHEGIRRTDPVSEMQARLQQLQALLDSQQNSHSQATSQLSEEVIALRAHVAQLEAQDASPWDPDEPPPAY